MSGILITAVYRRRDKPAKQLEQDYGVLDKVVVELDKLADKTATKDDVKELKELLSIVKQAARRFSKIPFQTVVATIETYEKTTITEECARNLAKVLTNKKAKVLTDKKSVDEALKLSREQGARITEIRTAIHDVQRIIDRLLRR
ncbi:hypothetical protein ABZT48_38585 [Streptomyces avermitilis]|uniref:hypothetical protein n=1 Tax=Streptomyces avermitilis TaxID=33903 RepID=UPI0033AAF30B